MDLKNIWMAVTATLAEQLDPAVQSELGPPAARFPLLFVLAVGSCSLVGHAWGWYSENVSAVGPAATFLGAAVVAWAALAQARTARLRHDEQTRADIHRRITESFSKAAEQLGSDKLAVRLGGIYTMERISRESWTDYWPAMETLSAIVRESGRLTQQTDSKITTDVAAVMEVLSRRSSDAKKYEVENHLFFDLSNADLRGAELYNLDFYAAQMNDVNLQGAELRGCKFKYGRLGRVNFSDADLSDIELSGAFLDDANFRGMRGENCSLYGTSLAHADFTVSGSVRPFPDADFSKA